MGGGSYQKGWLFYKLGYPIQHTFRDPKGWGCAWANFFVRLLFIVRAHTSWPLPSLQETLSHQIYAMQPPKFASKLPQLIALLQQITPSCNKCPPLLKISTRLITTRRNLRKLTLFCQRRKRGLLKRSTMKTFPHFKYIWSFFSSLHILKVRYFGLDLGIRWFDTLMLSKWLDACVCVFVCMAEWSSEWLWCRFRHNPLLHPTSNLTPHTGYLKLYAQLANWDPIFMYFVSENTCISKQRKGK